jgi:hypothetical protein
MRMLTADFEMTKEEYTNFAASTFRVSMYHAYSTAQIKV